MIHYFAFFGKYAKCKDLYHPVPADSPPSYPPIPEPGLSAAILADARRRRQIARARVRALLAPVRP